jgi:phosphoribosylformimino-5-aminoimidazole carboxamide ribotide isomerase
MIVYPAIDIRNGRVVRLMHGDPNFESVYGDDPVEVAKRWQAAGSEWVHVVNLDGALGETETALDILRDIVETGLSVQFGGGIRSLDSVQLALDAGAKRVVIGTPVVKQPTLAIEAVERFSSEAFVVALDAKGGKVVTNGWQETTEWTPITLGKNFAKAGVTHALYTDVDRDGDLSGVNVASTSALARETGLKVMASGGVATLDDLKALKKAGNIAGVIIGRALYANIFTLEAALAIAQEDE